MRLSAPRRIDETLLLSAFLLSGFAALAYQVCWQRILFATFGVDTERIVAGVQRFDPAAQPSGRSLEVITDQNMINEYKYGRTVQGFLRGEP